MKKSVLILALIGVVMSCSNKDKLIPNNTSDSLLADTMTSGTVPVAPDTMSISTIPDRADKPKDSTVSTK